jgi:hypothetical protein
MTTTEPDHSTVLAAIELANRAPSVHNTQPWHWLVGNHSVHLMADHTHHVSATDPAGRDLLLSCGAALHHLRVAFTALGWQPVVHRIPHQNDIDHLAAVETRPHPPTDDDLALAGAITRRRTDRRRFTSWEVPADHLHLLVRDAAGEGALLVPVTDSATRWQLTRAIELVAHRQLEPAMRRGIRIGGPVRHDDTAMRVHPRGALDNALTGRGGQDGGRLLVLATLNDDPTSVLRAGEAASAATLTAADLGLATCLLSLPLEVIDTRVTLRDQVLDGAAEPHLILRVGWAPPSAPPLPHSPVRRTEDTVDYLPGTHRR